MPGVELTSQEWQDGWGTLPLPSAPQWAQEQHGEEVLLWGQGKVNGIMPSLMDLERTAVALALGDSCDSDLSHKWEYYPSGT